MQICSTNRIALYQAEYQTFKSTAQAAIYQPPTIHRRRLGPIIFSDKIRLDGSYRHSLAGQIPLAAVTASQAVNFNGRAAVLFFGIFPLWGNQRLDDSENQWDPIDSSIRTETDLPVEVLRFPRRWWHCPGCPDPVRDPDFVGETLPLARQSCRL